VEVADSFRMVAGSALCPVSLVVQADRHCAVEQTYLHELGRIGAAVDDARVGSHNVLLIPALAESRRIARSSMPLSWSTGRCS
jgi:hypothetical protein